MTQACVVCGGQDWRPLPSPSVKLMITTAGKLGANRCGKNQGGRCGAVQKVDGGRLADTDYYERQYTYYDRPGAQTFDVARYRALARWLEEAAAPARPRRVFDVGCGRGGTMQYLREAWPGAHFAGRGPPADPPVAARRPGLHVSGRRPGAGPPGPPRIRRGFFHH